MLVDYGKHKIVISLFFIMFTVGFLLILSSLGLYPSAFGDEYLYNKYIRLVPLKEVGIPSYLYFLVYRLTTICGEGFLDCARILNVIFFVSAMPFIFFIGRKITNEKIALFIAALSIMGPINAYTAYLIPESFYFFSFWVLTFLILRIKQESFISDLFFIGSCLGLMALIKPHALFLIPALLIYLFIIQNQFSDKQSLYHRIRNCLIFLVTVMFVKTVAGFCFVGFSGINMFGSIYTSFTPKSLSQYFGLINLAIENGVGHILSLCMVFSVGVASLILTLISFFHKNRKSIFQTNIALYTVLVLSSLVIVVTFFTVNVGTFNNMYENTRLHMRYYNFTFPLLLLIVASGLSGDTINFSITKRAIIGFLVGVLTIYFAYTNLLSFKPSFFDSPEIYGFIVHPKFFYVLIGLSICSLILWVFSVKAGTAMFLFVYIPLTFFSSSYVTHKLLRNNIVPDVTARAGIFAKQYLPRADIIKTLIIVPEGYSFFKPLYHMDNPKDSSYLLLKKGMTYDMSKISGDKEWLLVIGENMFANNNLFQVPMNGFTLMRTNNRQEIDFKKPFWPGTITKTQGLGGVEPWGAWSAGDVLTIEFLQSLPRKFKVILSAYAYGENVGKEFIAHVGDSSIKFTIQSTPGKSPDIVSLEFENPNQSNILRIDMPSLGEIENKLMSNNQRLSLGLVFLSVEEI